MGLSLRLLLSLPLWLAFLALRTLLILVGWIVVPISAALGAYEKYQGADGVGTPRDQYRFTWRWMWLWDNQEDGIANDTYVKFDSMFMRIVYWSCFRNPVNNLRYVPLLSCKIDPSDVYFIGSKDLALSYDKKPAEVEWFYAWHGVYSNIWVQFEMFGGIWRFWLGWKIFPSDMYGVSTYRKDGAGFAIQFKRLS